MVKVTAVQPGSIAAELGLLPGTELLSVNGRELEDFLDWEFLTAEDEFVVHARQPDGEEIEYEIEWAEGMPLGVSLEPPRIRRCANRCDFCFVDGLPQGLRETLYIRDDDYRLSFKYGNFATLTNLKPWDVQRIIDYRLSPLYVSVHATDPVIRRYLLRNPLAPDVLDQLRYFAAHGIEFHTQIVMSPGVNDGEVLDRSLADLYELGRVVHNVSVVPVGLTEFSKHNLVREPTREECVAAIRQLEQWAIRAGAEREITWAYGADELYLRAGLELPTAAVYGDFEQVENGVGSVRYLQKKIWEERDSLGSWAGKRIAVLTGTSMGALLPQVLGQLEQWAVRAAAERGITWAYGADELYLRAGLELPTAAVYGDFEQVENGVGSVRYLQKKISEERDSLGSWAGKRIAVLTGTSMGALLPQVLGQLREYTGAQFELLVLENTLFGTSVTCAGLLPGSAFRQALLDRKDLDLALLPAESINDDGLFMDDLSFESLATITPVEIRPSYFFADALDTPVAA